VFAVSTGSPDHFPASREKKEYVIQQELIRLFSPGFELVGTQREKTVERKKEKKMRSLAFPRPISPEFFRAPFFALRPK